MGRREIGRSLVVLAGLVSGALTAGALHRLAPPSHHPGLPALARLAATIEHA